MATTRKTTGRTPKQVVSKVGKAKSVTGNVGRAKPVARQFSKTAAVHDPQGHAMKVATGLGHEKHHYTGARVRGSRGKLARARRFLDIVSTAGGVLLREPKPAKRH